MLNEYKCPLCGSTNLGNKITAKDYITNVKGEFVYYECQNCHSYVQIPAPTEEFLVKCYKSQNTTYKVPQNVKQPIWFVRKSSNLENEFNKRFYKKNKSYLLEALVPNTPAPAKMLEIGAAYGLYLNDKKQKGYNVVGVELSKESCDKAKELYNLDLINDVVENVNFPENNFDIVVMSMVLEHLTNPKEIIKIIHKTIKDKGELLISIPVADGFEFQRFKEYSYNLHPPYHITIPSIKGVEELIRGLFEIQEIQFQVCTNDLCKAASFAKKDYPSLFNKFFAWADKYLQSYIRMYLRIAIKNGLKTSRVSIRLKCIK